MNRALVNVATGDYSLAQSRLITRTLTFDPDCKIFAWKTLPAGWPTHTENPYAFKAYALKEAAKEAALLLWCDAVVCPVKPLDRLWAQIERDGYWFGKNGWTNYEWTADGAYKDLFPGWSIDRAREINKTFPQLVGTAFGVNLLHPIGRAFLDEYYRLAQTRAFCGPWSNTNNPKAHMQHESRMGPCGPSDVLGHRHDQTAASVIAWRLGAKLTECPDIFSYYPPKEGTILCADGGFQL